jgi:tetratricopeptide (TPR) repeat protein
MAKSVRTQRRAPRNAPVEQHRRLFLWVLFSIVALAFLIRLAYVFQIRESPFFDVLIGDARQYDAWAGEIAAGDWKGHGVFYQAPLYPYFLGSMYATIGRNLIYVRICQAAIGAAACGLLALAARRVVSEAAGVIAGIGLAMYAPAIFFDGLLQKSTLDVFFVSLVLWATSLVIHEPERRSRWLALGTALGALSLTRENALILGGPILIWGVWRAHTRRRLATALAFIVGLLLVLSPVAVRNRLVGGEWHLTTSQFGSNFYLGNNPSADGTVSPLRQGRGTAEYERQDATELAQAAVGRTLTAGEVSIFWTNQALSFIRANPLTWLKLEARKALLLLNRAELVDTDSQDSYEEVSPLLYAAAWVGHFGVLVPLAAFGMLIGWRERRLWLFYAMSAAYALSILLFYVSARYRLPLVPFLILFAASGMCSLSNFMRLRQVRKAGVAAAVIAIAVLANWPLWSAESMRAVTENNLGNALQIDGRLRDAEVHYRRAIELRPDYTPAYINLGTLQSAQGRTEDALASYKQASMLEAVDVDLDAKIGNALLKAGKPAEAAMHFERALSAGRESPEVYNNLIVSLIGAGRPDDAISVFRDALRQFPNDGLLHFRLGTLLLERDRASEAEAEFRAGLAIVPDSAEGHSNLGAALGALGRTRDAIAEFDRALQLNPDLVSAQRNLELTRRIGSRPASPRTH